MIEVGIIGGTGYTGVELLRILLAHSEVSIKVITSRSEAGVRIDALYPNLRGISDLEFSEPDLASLKTCDVVFSATPNGIAMTYARELMEAGVKLIDLAADFRIKDASVWQEWYGMEHACPELIQQAVYGLPEFNRAQIAKADLVANPGCYPTATSLALMPALANGLVDIESIIVDAKSGVTGAGRGASVATLYSEVSDSFKPYAVAGHRHHPEIKQTLTQMASKEVGLTFVPHLVPMLRGILSTIYVSPKSDDLDLFLETYASVYQNEPFVDVLEAGLLPETRTVKSTNMCRIAITKAGGSDKVVITSVIDNLNKGAAGQAVQNMNLMFGLSETLGLARLGLTP